jgi:predicted nucleic acid-binding protein
LKPVLVLDACVLMSGLLRPTLLSLAQSGLFAPIWSDRIGEEWRRNAARLWPIEPMLLKAEWEKMDAAFPHANAGDVSAYESGLRHSDKKDWHVIAAGLAALERDPSAEATVLTWNLKDFRRSELRQRQLGLSDPDRLLSLWWVDHSVLITEAFEATIHLLIESGRRQPDSFTNFLKRDRLFRLAALANARPVAP